MRLIADCDEEINNYAIEEVKIATESEHRSNKSTQYQLLLLPRKRSTNFSEEFKFLDEEFSNRGCYSRTACLSDNRSVDVFSSTRGGAIGVQRGRRRTLNSIPTVMGT